MLFNGGGTLKERDRRCRGGVRRSGGRAADRRLSAPGRRSRDLRPARRKGRGGVSGPGAAAAAPPLAILCGAGAFPLEVAAEARRAGREPFLVGVVGATNSAIEAYPHVWVRMGEVGKLFAALHARAIAEMVIIGAMARPEFADLRLDWGAVKRAAGLAQLFRRGDNGLLVGLAAIFEREGIRVVGAHEVAPRLVAPLGPIRRARGVAGGRNGHRARRSPPRRAVELRRRAGRGRRRRPGAGDRGGRRHRRDARAGRRDARATDGCASPVLRACW